MRNLWKKAAAACLTAVMGASLLAGCGSKDAKIDGTKTAVTINDEKVSLGAVSFQTRYRQAYMYQLYTMYLGSTQIFDQIVDESSEKTSGDQLKEDVLDEIEELVLLKQHAADYDVALTDEQKDQIAKIAQAYIDENSEEVRAEIGASVEDVSYLLELQTIRDLMREPMAADVDTEVSDEEAQQTTVTYISIAKETEDSAEAPADESLSDESVSEEAKAEALDKANADIKAKAEQILEKIKAESDIANADMGKIAGEVDEELTAASGQFTTNEPTETTLDAAMVEAASGLKDGELYDKVIDTDSYYYIVRLDKTFAEDETNAKKEEIVTSRKTDAYNELVEKWKKEATITVDEPAMATLLITDSATYILSQDESAADESLADEAVSDESAADGSPADESALSEDSSAASSDTSAAESRADTSSADESTTK